MNILDKIKNWRKSIYKMRLRKRMNSINPNPHIYDTREHKTWGDNIEIRRINDNGTFKIVGWLGRLPKNGDKLIYDVQSGKRAYGYIADVEYCNDPRDMFFAIVIPFEYVD